MLDTHNTYRAQNQAGPLTWSTTLASYAQENAAGCVFQHTGGPYGENLAAGYGSIEASIAAWYEEQSDYNFNDPGFSVSSLLQEKPADSILGSYWSFHPSCLGRLLSARLCLG
jgi:uncharacterized protein YkwD